MRLTETQRVTVMCLVDLGYTCTSIWREGLYDNAYPIVARLLATHGALEDVMFPSMTDEQRSLALIISDWMQLVYNSKPAKGMA